MHRENKLLSKVCFIPLLWQIYLYNDVGGQFQTWNAWTPWSSALEWGGTGNDDSPLRPHPICPCFSLFLFLALSQVPHVQACAYASLQPIPASSCSKATLQVISRWQGGGPQEDGSRGRPRTSWRQDWAGQFVQRILASPLSGAGSKRGDRLWVARSP